MKKITLLALAASLSFTAFCQQKKDTTIQITMNLEQFKSLLYTIDSNIDSKKLSKEVVDFLKQSASVVADKPKEIKP